MTFSILLLQTAEQDLDDLKLYFIKNFGAHLWLDRYEKIKKAINMLKTFPLTGKIPEELEKIHFTQYRQIISANTKIIYEIRENTIYVHLICDARKEMRSLLINRLLRCGS